VIFKELIAEEEIVEIVADHHRNQRVLDDEEEKSERNYWFEDVNKSTIISQSDQEFEEKSGGLRR